jgi:hypothetical protein
MSISKAETYLRNARQQITQKDINASVVRAISELIGEIKRIDDEVRRIRRDIQFRRRFE